MLALKGHGKPNLSIAVLTIDIFAKLPLVQNKKARISVQNAMKLSDRIMIFFLLHRSINTPENIPKMPCGNMAAIVANAKVSADLVSKVSHKMMAKLTRELVSMEKNCPVHIIANTFFQLFMVILYQY